MCIVSSTGSRHDPLAISPERLLLSEAFAVEFYTTTINSSQSQRSCKTRCTKLEAIRFSDLQKIHSVQFWSSRSKLLVLWETFKGVWLKTMTQVLDPMLDTQSRFGGNSLIKYEDNMDLQNVCILLHLYHVFMTALVQWKKAHVCCV